MASCEICKIIINEKKGEDLYIHDDQILCINCFSSYKSKLRELSKEDIVYRMALRKYLGLEPAGG